MRHLFHQGVPTAPVAPDSVSPRSDGPTRQFLHKLHHSSHLVYGQCRNRRHLTPNSSIPSASFTISDTVSLATTLSTQTSPHLVTNVSLRNHEAVRALRVTAVGCHVFSLTIVVSRVVELRVTGIAAGNYDAVPCPVNSLAVVVFSVV